MLQIGVNARERLSAGDTSDQAIAFMVARYGNFILLKPPMQLDTLALWFGPAIFLLVAAAGFGRYLLKPPGKGAERHFAVDVVAMHH